MEKIFTHLATKHLLFLCFVFVITTARSQAPSCQSELSPICMIKTGTYNKHTHVTSKDIQIGQGTVFSWNSTVDVYIPPNRVGWAIGMAVAHTMFSNLIGIENMSINEYFATALQETNCGCDGSITKPAWVTNKYPVNPAVYCSDYTHGVAVGYFQQEFGTGWAELKKDYPCFIPKVNFDTFVVGKNFETQVLAKVYQDYNSIYYLQQNRCFNPIDFIKQSKDPYAAEKIIAEVYNEGMWGQNLENLLKKNRTAALNATDILPYFCTNGVLNMNGYPSVGYSERISRVTAVLDNNLGDVSATSAQANGVTWVGVHKWRDFYDSQVTWTDIQSYINNISRMYAGVGVTAAAVIAKVKPVFDAINGGNSVSFRYDLGPVIDAIVSALPVFNPTGLGAYGNCGAFPTATMQKSDTVCVGQPLNLTVKFAGKAPFTFTYADTKGNQWTKTGVVSNTYNFAPADTGTYYLVSLSDASGNTGKVVCTPVIKAYNNNGAKGDLQMYGNAGACNGKGLQIKFTGTGPYNIEYSKDGVAQTPVNNITANPYTLIAAPAPLGKYILTKVTAAGCVNTSKDTVDITAGTAPTASISGGASICQGDSTQLTVALTGVAPFKIKLNDGSTLWYKSGISPAPTSYKFWVKTAGTYTVDSVYDAACSAKGTGSSAVTLNPSPTISTTGSTAICAGDTAKVIATLTGKAPFSIKATSGALSVNFNTSLSTYVIAFTVAGTYTLELTDANNCKTTKNITITSNNSPSGAITGTGSVCKGDSVKLTVNLTGTQPWKIKISDGTNKYYKSAITASPYNFYAKTSGTYTLDSVWDATCSAKGSGSSVVTINANPSISFSGDTNICMGDTAKIITTLTGKAPYSILVSNGAITIPLNTSLSTYIIPLTIAGTYTINLTDGNGCKTSKSITILQKTSPVVDLGNDATICQGGTKTLDAGATMQSYSWTGAKTGNAQTMLADLTGKYKVTVTNNDGCKASDSVNITLQSSMITKFAQDTMSICAGTSTNLQLQTLSGGTTPYNYQWSGDASGTNNTYTANAKGTYIITVSDSKGCKSGDTIIVKENSKLSVSLVDKTICPGDSLILSTSLNGAGYTYAWNTGETSSSITVKTAGTYGVVVNSGTCSGSDSMNLTVLNPPAINLGQDQNICVNTKAVLDAGNTFVSYLWNTNETVSSVQKGAGKYWVKVKDNQGCSATDTIVVNEIPNPKPDKIRDTNICKNSSLTLDESAYNNNNGPYTYLWDDNSTNVSLVLNNQTSISVHWVELTDKYGCKGRDTAHITIKADLNVIVSGNPDTVLCAGATTVLSSQISGANYQYSWSTGETTPSISVNTSGTYTLNVDDGNGCKGADAVKVIVNPLPDMTKVAVAAAVCSGDAAVIGYDFGVGYTYSWNTSNLKNARISTTTAGTNIFTVISDKGCVNDTTINVTVNQKPLIEIGNNIDTCEGVVVMLTDNLNTPGLSYSWTKKSSGATVISSVKDVQINSSDVYKLKAIDSNGCWSADSLNAVFKITPQVDLLGGKDSAVICNNESITLDAANVTGATYVWLPTKENTRSIVVNDAGTYWVIVANGNCYASDTVYVQSLVLPKDVLTDALLPIQPNYCFAEESNGVEISAVGIDGLNYNYFWNTNETSQKIVVKQKGTYTVEIQKDKCKTSSSVSIVDYCETNFFIPDAFTPNSDNNNDVFKVYGAYIPNFEILIFNRWGEQIYQSKDYTQGWDGTYMGNKVQEDVYVVKIVYGVNQENGTVKRHERLSKLVVLY